LKVFCFFSSEKKTFPFRFDPAFAQVAVNASFRFVRAGYECVNRPDRTWLTKCITRAESRQGLFGDAACKALCWAGWHWSLQA